MEFFERLYRGFEAEHYVAGKLFSVGYEAFKLPADFGFDLMVTNQKEQSMGPRQKGRLLEPPFAVQVKSRSLRSSDFQTAASGRDEARVSVSIKKESLDLLVGTKRNFLVVVLFVDGDARRFEDRAIHFWFGSDHINALLERGYFLPNQADRRVRNLRCSLRMLPMLSVRDLLDSLVSQNHLTQEGKGILASELPERVPRNWNASEYVALAREARNASDELVWRSVPHELCDFRNMGFDIGLGHLD
ncbi:MAG: hypothetical protein JW896_08220 [Deltaproteobacteria bacterium]|nr:hypothetical protein [Deltaproteobacteria bacterium]